MKKVIYKADDRGEADMGWLKAKYSFSFANHYNPDKVHFGALRVLNDDRIAPSMGFGMHPHDNMEIITIPLKGAVKHKDSMGNTGVIKAGEIQIMSAGKGIVHSEFNASHEEELNLFQVWLFPKERNIQPHYDQRAYTVEERRDKFQVVVSPNKEDGTLWINQDAWFSLGNFKAGEQVQYDIKLAGNGAYLMVVEGEIEVAGETLGKRDAIGLSELKDVAINVTKDAELLLIDLPMQFEA